MNRVIKIFLAPAGVLLFLVLAAPMPRFKAPLSTVVEAADGSLLGARIAADGQWRFPASDSVPLRFEKALLTFEDRHFYLHPGINPVSITRAFMLNIKKGSIVSGGSTITMQTARLAGGERKRTYSRKILEMLSAVKLEIFRSKRSILLLYVSNAPFGGNTVGIDAASWRYYAKAPGDLSWAEAAALAVLPNSPSLVYPGKNETTLKEKRNRLLREMNSEGIFDSLTLSLALEEPLPSEPLPLPASAPHLTDYFFKTNRGRRIRTTIDPRIQEKVNTIIGYRQKELAANLVFNTACIVVETNSGNVLAYTGNSKSGSDSTHGADVDIIRAERSTGSILKPILYAAMLSSGQMLPNALVADIPTRFQGFAPVNFDNRYSGAVPASGALAQSLNIPAVRMLMEYDPRRFLELLRETGFTSFRSDAGHYGLSLILGGGETSLWELAGVYASMARTLNRFNSEGRYLQTDFHEPQLVAGRQQATASEVTYTPPLSASSLWLTFEALKKVNRPEGETGWQYFDSSRDIAWKTGTSYGFRDAWAVATTPDYVVAAWAGNADGEGRPGLTGITAAAPVMFDVLAAMPRPAQFNKPLADLTTIKVCSKSGFRAGPDCPDTEEAETCVAGLRSLQCPYHKIVHLSRDRLRQVNTGCAPAGEIVNTPWFVLPPAMEFYYRKVHPAYEVLPPFAPGCLPEDSFTAMEFIYPASGMKIFIPRGATGEKMKIIAEVAHRNPSKKIYWHLDDSFLTQTVSIHQAVILAPPGEHMITAVDEDGNSIRCTFTII